MRRLVQGLDLVKNGEKWTATKTIKTKDNKSIYTPENEHDNDKSSFSIGNTSSNGWFSIVMLVSGGVTYTFTCPIHREGSNKHRTSRGASGISTECSWEANPTNPTIDPSYDSTHHSVLPMYILLKYHRMHTCSKTYLPRFTCHQYMNMCFEKTHVNIYI